MGTRKGKFKVITILLLGAGVLYILCHISGYTVIQPMYKAQTEAFNSLEGNKVEPVQSWRYFKSKVYALDPTKAPDPPYAAHKTINTLDTNLDFKEHLSSNLNLPPKELKRQILNLSSYFDYSRSFGKVVEEDFASKESGDYSTEDEDSSEDDSAESSHNYYFGFERQGQSFLRISQSKVKHYPNTEIMTTKETKSFKHEDHRIDGGSKADKNDSSSFGMKSETSLFSNNHYQKHETSKGCQITSIREQVDHLIKYSKSCRENTGIFDTCKDADTYFPGAVSAENTSCSGSKYANICNVSIMPMPKNWKVTCNSAICSSSKVYVHVFDGRYGVFSEKAIIAHNNTELESLVFKSLESSLKQGFEVLLIKCDLKLMADKIKQVILVPKIRISSQQRIHTKPNINVLVIDSVSRKHFYRALPKTLQQMKVINSNPQKASTILDFESFQSLAPFTFVNVQSFMASKQDFKSVKDRRIEFDRLFQPFKESGYHITLQEDTCWYDMWGSVMTSFAKRSKEIKSKKERKANWVVLKEIQERHKIDSSGLSHLSCEVFKTYGKSNMFNRGTFCLNGVPLSAYFLDFVVESLADESEDMYTPQLVYTHLNIAHERSGVRIKSVDSQLADFVNKMASLKNTLTIIWSDHGGKTTDYAMYSLAGRFEVYDPFLFMIFPKRIMHDLPRSLFLNVIKNQWSLLSAQDLHFTLLFLVHYYKFPSVESIYQERDKLGLFSDMSNRSSCDSLPIREYALCKCKQNTQLLAYEENKHLITWVAEFALGSLNNELTSSHASTSTKLFRRACLRFIGKSTKNVLYLSSSKGNRIIADILVHSPSGKADEIYNVQIGESENDGKYLLKMIHWQRISIYERFRACKDSATPIELCLCDRKRRSSAQYFASYLKRKIFGSSTRVRQINSTCIYQLTRDHFNTVRVIELANFCSKRQWTLEVSPIRVTGWKLSHKLPSQLTLPPLSVHFVVSGLRLKGKGLFFDVKVHKL